MTSSKKHPFPPTILLLITPVPGLHQPTATMPPTANAAGAGNFQRQTHYNPDNFWNSTARPLWNKLMDIPFDSIGWTDLEGDLGIMLLNSFAKKLGDGVPVSDHTGRPYMASTLKDAFKKVIEKLKTKFSANIASSNGELFPSDDVDAWLKRLRDGHQRQVMEGTDEQNLLKKIFPLPRKHGPRTSIFPLDDIPDPDIQAERKRTDLGSICRKLFKDERFEDLAKIVITYKGIARGGEVKFLSYQRMFYDTQFNTLFTQWFQRKTLKSNPSGFTADYEGPETCVFFSLGCYWACNNGLLRQVPGEPGSPQARLAGYVFQDLHGMRDDSVAKQLTEILRSRVHHQLRKFISIKSCRFGSMTELAYDPAVAYEEGVALGGWATGSNSDWYVWTYLVAIVPPILTLAGYPDPRVIAHLPRKAPVLHSVPVEFRMTFQQWNMFLDALFPNSLPEFSPPCGRLREFMDCVAAVMVMHFSHVYSTYGISHPCVSVMISAVVNVGFTASRSGAVQRLQVWSRAIREDFRKGNCGGDGASTEQDSTNQLIRRRTIQQEVAKLSTNVARVVTMSIDIQAQLVLQNNKLSRTEQELHDMRSTQQHMVQQQEDLARKQQDLCSHIQQNNQLLQELLKKLDSGAVRSGPPQNVQQNAPPPPPTPDRTVPPLPTTTTRDHTTPLVSVPVPPATRAVTEERDGRNGPLEGLERLPLRPSAASVPTGPPTGHARAPLQASLAQHTSNESSRQKGKQAYSEFLDHILDEMYKEARDHKSGPFFSLRSAGPALEHQTTWVCHRAFGNRDKVRSKVELALKFIDGVWTEEERDSIINMRSSSYIEATRLHARFARKVKETLFLLMKDQKKTQPSKKFKAALVGMANNINKTIIRDRLDQCVPDWAVGGVIAADKTLTQLAAERKEQISRRVVISR